jgi:LysM repeat protein
MNRRYVLKNRRRFYSIIVILVTVMLSSVIVVSAQGGEAECKYDTVRVETGDTLWDIAKEYNPNGDIREFIYEIKELNHLEGSMIYAGEELKVPVHF